VKKIEGDQRLLPALRTGDDLLDFLRSEEVNIVFGIDAVTVGLLDVSKHFES
jgi:hypothetical protein